MAYSYIQKNGGVLESSTYTSPDASTRRFTFTCSAINLLREYDFASDVFGAYPKAVSISNNTMTVDFDEGTGVSECRLYIYV